MPDTDTRCAWALLSVWSASSIATWCLVMTASSLARALSVQFGGKHEGDRVGLDPLCVAQPGTGTLIDGPPRRSWHRDSFRPTGRVGDFGRSIG